MALNGKNSSPMIATGRIPVVDIRYRNSYNYPPVVSRATNGGGLFFFFSSEYHECVSLLFDRRRAQSKVSQRSMQTAVLVSYARTPIGKLGGGLASKSASELGAVAVKAAVSRAGLEAAQVEEVILGNVVSAGIGQAPARQAAKFAGLPDSVCCTTINKVCASGMKSVMFAAQQVMLGQRDVVVAGGMESMTNIPYYMPSARNGARFGHSQVVDGIIHDGLWDIYNDQHMGMVCYTLLDPFL